MKINAARMAILAMAIGALGCGRGANPRAEAPGLHGSSPSVQGESAPGLQGESASQSAYAGVSIYALDSALTDQDGRALRLKDLAGKVVVAAMAYTSCPAVCPRIVADMQAVEGQLPEHARNGVQFVLFSLDPTRDTPEVRRRFAAEHRLSGHWTFLAGTDDDVRDLAAVLGMKYQREDNGETAHSAMIFVLDRTGVVRHRQAGLNGDNAQILAAIAATR